MGLDSASVQGLLPRARAGPDSDADEARLLDAEHHGVKVAAVGELERDPVAALPAEAA